MPLLRATICENLHIVELNRAILIALESTVSVSEEAYADRFQSARALSTFQAYSQLLEAPRISFHGVSELEHLRSLACTRLGVILTEGVSRAEPWFWISMMCCGLVMYWSACL